MDVDWQYNNPSNPADVAIGSQIYDYHSYYLYVQLSSSLANCVRVINGRFGVGVA